MGACGRGRECTIETREATSFEVLRWPTRRRDPRLTPASTHTQTHTQKATVTKGACLRMCVAAEWEAPT